ncbi:MAG: hypothetical protein ABI689_17530 [Thermoanaerobaculia bacterium]
MRRAGKERSLAWALAGVAAVGAAAFGGYDGAPAGDGAVAVEHFRQEVRDLLAPKATKGVFAGTGGWLFLRSEIQGAAGLGPWIGTRPTEDTTPGAPVEVLDAERSDELAAVEDFALQLRQRDLPFLFVLVPPKFEVYPDRLLAGADARALGLGEAQRRFVAGLAEREVAVLDLAPLFHAERARTAPEGESLFASQDTHWSPYAARLAADAIAARLRAGGFAAGPGLRLTEETTTRDDCGDLWGKLKPPRPPCNSLTLYGLRSPGSESLAATVDRASPLLLLGDSSSVVYHEPYRAGLADHLANALGQTVDLLAVTAGGANGAREALARRSATSGGLDGKKFVVWVVSGRLLYEYPAWQKIELPRAIQNPATGSAQGAAALHSP